MMTIRVNRVTKTRLIVTCLDKYSDTLTNERRTTMTFEEILKQLDEIVEKIDDINTTLRDVLNDEKGE